MNTYTYKLPNNLDKTNPNQNKNQQAASSFSNGPFGVCHLKLSSPTPAFVYSWCGLHPKPTQRVWDATWYGWAGASATFGSVTAIDKRQTCARASASASESSTASTARASASALESAQRQRHAIHAPPPPPHWCLPQSSNIGSPRASRAHVRFGVGVGGVSASASASASATHPPTRLPTHLSQSSRLLAPGLGARPRRGGRRTCTPRASCPLSGLVVLVG